MRPSCTQPKASNQFSPKYITYCSSSFCCFCLPTTVSNRHTCLGKYVNGGGKGNGCFTFLWSPSVRIAWCNYSRTATRYLLASPWLRCTAWLEEKVFLLRFTTTARRTTAHDSEMNVRYAWRTLREGPTLKVSIICTVRCWAKDWEAWLARNKCLLVSVSLEVN